MKPDMETVIDRGESIDMMLPMKIGAGSPRQGALLDLAMELAEKSGALRGSLRPGIRTALAALVRSTGCHFSNLIAGHDLHPIEIELALRDAYSADPQRHRLQREAKAHVAVQEWIDAGGLAGRAVSRAGLIETHRRFCAQLPDELLWTELPRTGERLPVIPGALRERAARAGRHGAVSPGAVPRFLHIVEWTYARLGRSEAIVAVAAAHHRLLWIRPFSDGNGRVARLAAQAMLQDTLDTGGLWSVARGLGRNIEAYKRHLADCDLPRRNDLDGRGTLSEEALAAFTSFFLRLCIEEVDFIAALVEPDRLRARIQRWAAEEVLLGSLPPQAVQVIDAILSRGELPRGEVEAIVGTGERQARRITGVLGELGVVVSESSRAPLRIAFPARLAARWMPGLFPERLG